MNVGSAARTTPLCGNSRKDVDDLEKRQLEELIKAAQTYGPKLALQLAQQLSGQAGALKTGDFNLSDVDGSKPRGTTSAFSNQEDLEKLLKDILKKQETAQASSGAAGAGTQGQQHQQPQMAQDVNLVQSRELSQMY
ncbi:MAG: hypothetical protein FJZ01_14035 [Candidatus Sericytochromatia bacterium]|nr:hypothetical protein [Candidatus Tanganyikabacteria bacterium]